ncbi:MAG: hypothetical protein V1738_06920 [Patescibacteria group bacterium]
MRAKKAGKKGRRRINVDALCRARSLPQFKRQHQHEQEGFGELSDYLVDIARLPGGGVEAHCHVCGATKRFAGNVQ